MVRVLNNIQTIMNIEKRRERYLRVLMVQVLQLPASFSQTVLQPVHNSHDIHKVKSSYHSAQ